MAESIRERVVRLIKEMRNRTEDRGATPAEAAAFAAKIAAWIEKYEIEEAELAGSTSAPVEACQEFIHTGKQVFNPGYTKIVDGLCRGMSCKLVMVRRDNQATYGIVGTAADAGYVCQMAATLVPLLWTMGRAEGAEHGHEKAGLVRWCNQYLSGAAEVIERRLIADRHERSEVKRIEHEEKQAASPSVGTGTALVLVTGDSLAAAKQHAAEAKFKELYPHCRTVRSKSGYDGTARRRGAEAGRNVGLNLQVPEGNQ